MTTQEVACLAEDQTGGLDKEYYDSLYNHEEYFLQAACEGYAEFQQGSLSFVKKEEMDLLDVQPGEVFLDLGCGRGEVLVYALKKTPHVIGIDCSAAALKIAERTCQGNGRFILGLASDISLEDHSVDKILVGDVIEHLHPTDAMAMAMELKRILKPGGTILIHTSPNLNFMRYVYPFAYLGIALLFPSQRKKLKAHVATRKIYHINEYTPRRLIQEVSRSGLHCHYEWRLGIFRGGNHHLTAMFKRFGVIPLLDQISILPALRDLLVNDLFLICRTKPST